MSNNRNIKQSFTINMIPKQLVKQSGGMEQMFSSVTLHK